MVEEYYFGGIIRGTAAERLAYTATNLPVNTVWIEKDTSFTFDWTGTAWRPRSGGTDVISSNFKISQDGANYRLVDLKNAGILSTNSDAAVVLNQASISAHNGGLLHMMPATYLCNSAWSLIDKNIKVRNERPVMSGMSGLTGDVIIKANYTDATGPLINMRNTVYSRSQLEGLVVDCNGTVAKGIDGYWITERYPFLKNVTAVGATDVGIELEKSWHCTFYDIGAMNCTNAGLRLKGATSGEMNNASYYYGGRIINNGINIEVPNYAIDLAFNGMLLEGNNDVKPITNLIKITNNNASAIRFRDCSFEYGPTGVNATVVSDGGVNNTIDNCRFAAHNTAFTPYRALSTNRFGKFINNNIMANAASTTATIQIDSGAVGVRILDNTQFTNTPLTVIIKDAGTNTIKLGNSFWPDSYLRIARFGSGRKYGRVFLGNASVFDGLCAGTTQVPAGATAAPLVAADKGRALRWTTGTANGDNAGIRISSTSVMLRAWDPLMSVRFRVNDITNSRVYIGFSSNPAEPAGDDPLNALNGVMLGKITTSANWQILHNDGVGATTLTDTGIAADVNIHFVDIIADDTNNRFFVVLDGTNVFVITSNIPATGTLLYGISQIEKSDAAAVARTYDNWYVELECN